MLGCQEVCHEHNTSGDNAEAPIINASNLDVTDQVTVMKYNWQLECKVSLHTYVILFMSY